MYSVAKHYTEVTFCLVFGLQGYLDTPIIYSKSIHLQDIKLTFISVKFMQV